MVQQERSKVISTFEGRDNEQTYRMFEQFVQTFSLTTNSGVENEPSKLQGGCLTCSLEFVVLRCWH